MMKKFSLIILIFASFLTINAQDKEISKIQKLYNQGNYEICIEKATKTIKKYPTIETPYVYKAFANFQLFITSQRLKKKFYLTNTLNNLSHAIKYDTSRSFFKNYKPILDSIHDTTLTFANKLWQQDKKGEAEFFYKKLATVFLDTTDQYHEIFDPKQPQKFEQNLAFKEYNGEINQTDINGNKQGLWVAKYPNGFVKYEIYFKDNHPAGIYRKYYENGQLKAKMFFNDNGDYASAILYDENGTKVAMGYYKNHKKDSLWQYFANGNIVIAEEHYKNGIKDGVEHTYSNFTNDEGMQVIIEEKFWKNGKLDSVWSRSYADGSPKFIAEYKNGIREGKYIAFDVDGKVTTAGQYKNNEPDGTWKYWNDSTLSYIEIKYINGVPQNYDELTEQETQYLKQLEKEKGKFVEPNQEIQQKYGGGVGNEN